MISIVDPKELEHVLRPTVYAAAVGAMPPGAANDPGENGRVPGRSKVGESTDREPLSP